MIIIGSRKSKLAMWQTNTIAAQLAAAGMKTQISSMETKGDRILNTSIAKIGSKGVFTEELEVQLATGATDIAVHSAKDMQSQLPEGFEIIAFSSREKANDVLLSDDKTIDIEDRNRKIRVGTSSVRRRALLNHYYPHIEAVEMRGNLQTRIQKMRDGDCDALMLAYAGVKRMDYEDMVVVEFDTKRFVPPVGQGCIAIEASSTLDVAKLKRIRSCLNDPETEVCLNAERAYLKKLEGGCSIPAFGFALLEGDDVVLTAGLASLDGSTIICKEDRALRVDAKALGERLGNYVLDHGGRELLSDIRRQQNS